MFELADYLVGIYKVTDCTESLTIKNSDKFRLLDKINEKENHQENSNDVNNLANDGQIPEEILSH
jgi:hypothetical protein